MLVIRTFFVGDFRLRSLRLFCDKYESVCVLPQKSLMELWYLAVSFNFPQHSGHTNCPERLFGTGVKEEPVIFVSRSLAL